jgi:hypothetical protein
LLRTPKRFGSPNRAGVATSVVVLALVVPASGWGEPRAPNPGLEKLWQQFPLDARPGAAPSRERSSEPAGTTGRGDTPSRERSIEPAGTITRVARPATAAPRSGANVQKGRGVPAAALPPDSVDKPAPWLQIALVLALLLPPAVALVWVLARRLQRLRARRGRIGPTPAALTADGTYKDAIADTRAIKPKPPSRVAEPADEPRVEESLRAPPAAPQPSRKSDPRKPVITHGSEVSKLKEKEKRPPDPVKELAPIESETEVIKSKPCSETEADLLRRKGAAHGGLVGELDDVTGTGLLKEKLAAERVTSYADVKPRLPAGGASQARLRSKLRALPNLLPGEEPPSLPGRALHADASRECEIRWRHGDEKSRFVAVVTQPLGVDRVVAASPEWSWRESDPPPETAETAEALRALVSRLVRDGWIVEGRGEAWYSIRLSTAASAAAQRSSVGE